MRAASTKLASVIVGLAVMIALLLGGAGAASAACTYSMTTVAEVAPGSTTPVGSLVITMDAATAGSSAGSSVDISLPTQPEGFGLTVTGYSLINATGSVVYANIEPGTVELTVNSLSPTSSGSVEIVLPLTISVPTGYNGNIGFSALAPSGSVFSSSNNLVAPASLGAPVLKVDPNSADFGGVNVGSAATEQTLTASDIGASSLAISSVSITGPNAGDFQVSQDNCSGQTLTVGQQATLEVVFTPAAPGARQAVLHVFSSDPSTPDYQVSLAGTGLSPAGGATGAAVFTIGSTSYTLNGNSVTMDVAPYIKDGRTFLPLRYVAEAAGVADSGITWDPATQEVTINKGGRQVQVTIGSTTMLINGEAVTMDAAPEITNGRTCLPFAWVAQALGANITWDAAAQTVTATF